MPTENLDILRAFYKLLLDETIRSEKKIKNNSVFWTLIKCVGKRRANIIDKSSQNRIMFDNEIFKELINSELLELNSIKNEGDYYNLTPKAIWLIEKTDRGLSEDDLVQFISSEYFDFKKKSKPINDKERLVLFTMIGVRNFSLSSKMELKESRDCDAWEKIFERSFGFLNSKKYFKNKYKSFSELISKDSSEHPIINLMRHTNDLPIKSDHIFNSPGGKLGKTYWLGLYEEDRFIEIKLFYLAKQIFGKIDNAAELQDIKNELNSIAHTCAKLVIRNFEFISSDYDDLIYEAIKSFYLTN